MTFWNCALTTLLSTMSSFSTGETSLKWLPQWWRWKLPGYFRDFQSKCFSGTLGPSTQYSISTELENFILPMRCAFLLLGESVLINQNHSPARLKLFKINWSDFFAINILCNDVFPSEDLEYWMIDAAYMEFCCSEKFFMKRDILQVFHPFNMWQTPFNLFLLRFHPFKIIRS